MAAWNRFYTPLTQWMNPSGVPLAFAELYFFESGSTTIPLETYADADLNSPNAHPVVADATGTFGPIFLQNLPYNVLLVEAGGDVNDPVWSADPVEPFVDSDVASTFYDMYVFFNSKPSAGETYPIANIPRTLELPADLGGSIFTVDAGSLPTGTATWTLQKNAVSIGTIAFAVDGTPTVTFLTDVSFQTGDQFSLAPAMQDTTMNFIAFTFVFTVL